MAVGHLMLLRVASKSLKNDGQNIEILRPRQCQLKAKNLKVVQGDVLIASNI